MYMRLMYTVHASGLRACGVYECGIRVQTSNSHAALSQDALQYLCCFRKRAGTDVTLCLLVRSLREFLPFCIVSQEAAGSVLLSVSADAGYR